MVSQNDMTGGLAKPQIDVGTRYELHSWDGPWVLAMEELEVTNRIKRCNNGLGTMLEMAYHDNKGRLSFNGPVDDAADTTNSPASFYYAHQNVSMDTAKAGSMDSSP